MPSIPQSVIRKDHELEDRSTRSTEELAKHRWHHTLDPKGPQFSFRAYAAAVGRSDTTIRAHAHGYERFVVGASAATSDVAPMSLPDAIELVRRDADTRAFSEAIAEGADEPIAKVARGDNAHRRGAIIEQAKQRAARRGTDPVDEAREIATQARQTREMEARDRQEAKSRRSIRYVHIEGHLAAAQRRLLNALMEAEGVGFDDEEMELIRDSIAKVRAVLNLIDLRMAGTPDVDWDAEAAHLMEGLS